MPGTFSRIRYEARVGSLRRSGRTAGSVIPVAFSYGYVRLRFIKPVFIGDTITCAVTIAEKRDHKRPEMGIVVEHFDVTNQRGEVVLVADHLLLVERRDQRRYASSNSDMSKR